MNYPEGIRQRGQSLLVDVTVAGIRKTATVKSLDVQAALLRQSELKTELLRAVGDRVATKQGWTLKQAYDKACETYWDDNEVSSGPQLRANAREALAYFGETTDVKRLDKDRLDEYAKFLRDKGVVNGTINRKMSAVSCMLKCAVESGKLEKKPTIKRKAEHEGRIRFLTPDEEKMVLSVLDQWGQDEHSEAVCVLIDTGMRPSELWRMEERDLDFLKGIIHVWKTKNHKARSIPMTTRVKDILWRRTQVITVGKLFDYGNSWMNKMWDRMQAHIGLTEDKEFIPYALRHTCISRLVQRGVPLKVVQEWAGHKNILTTMRYAHLCPTNLLEAVKVLEAV